jgi:hypothetical protein
VGILKCAKIHFEISATKHSTFQSHKNIQYFVCGITQQPRLHSPTVDDDVDVIVEVKKPSVVPSVSEESEASFPTLPKLPSLTVSSIHSDDDEEASGEELCVGSPRSSCSVKWIAEKVHIYWFISAPIYRHTRRCQLWDGNIPERSDHPTHINMENIHT